MFMYFGWIQVVQSEESSQGEFQKQLNSIKDKLSELKELFSEGRLFELKAVNGCYHLAVSGVENRKDISWDIITEFIEYIAVTVPQSYGLIYTRNTIDWEGNENPNAFTVYTIKTGLMEVSAIQDPYLSPCVPLIEEA